MDATSEFSEIKLLGSFLAAILMLLIGTGAAYFRFGVSLPEVRVMLLGIGIVANLLLVSAYILTLIQNRRMDLRDRERPLQKEILSDIIQTSINAINQNQANLLGSPYSGAVEPNNMRFLADNELYLEGYLFLPAFNQDSRAFDRLRDSRPDIIRSMNYHDRQLFDLIELEHQLKEEMVSRFEQRLETTQVNMDTLEKLAILFLRDAVPAEGHPDFEFYTGHKEELLGISGEFDHSHTDYREYIRQQNNYFDIVEELEEELKKYQEKMRFQYGIEST